MSDHDSHPDVPRRGFFAKAVAAIVGGLVGMIPAALAGGFLLGPILGRNRNADTDATTSGDGFLPLPIGPDALPVDGTPQAVTVVADRIDAWNFYPQERVGSVWLRKNDAGEIIAFNSICPHLGCSVDYRPANTDFFCPCHFSAFDLNGERQNAIPPRPMDSLETKIGEDGRIWVKFENYRGGIEEKVPV